MIKELKELIARDAALCAAMADEIGAYLKSNVLFWEPDRRRPGGAQLPKLTIGALLLAMRRLETLTARLGAGQRQALARAGEALDLQKSEWRVRYETKLARDLHSRLDAWAWYVDDVERQSETAVVHYPHRVATRVRIDLLLEEAGEIGLDAEASRQRQSALDARLRGDFVPGDFCWLDPLADGFSEERFWYLWGHL